MNEYTPHAPRHLVFRRAVLAVLLRADRPVPIADVVAALSREPVLAPVTPKRVSDVLRQQRHRGWVRRVSRGVYEVVPGAMSRSTEWRCRNWRRVPPADRLT